MKKLKIAVLTLVTALTILSPFTVFAAPATEDFGTYSQDEIEYIYREYNGVLQYRRWNATKGIWVDPYWINVV